MKLQGRASGFIDQGSVTPENLIAGEFPRTARMVTITGNANLPIGAVLGIILANGKAKVSDPAATDGSEIPQAILGESVDTTAGDAIAMVYFSGEFNELALSWGPGHTLDSIKEALRIRSFFLRQNQP